MTQLTKNEIQEAAETSELLAEELIRRGEYMLNLGKRLLVQVSELRAAVDIAPTGPAAVTVTEEHVGIAAEGEERSINSAGEIVTFANAVGTARKLGDFTRLDFTAALKLNGAQGIKWIHKLLRNKPHPIIEAVRDTNGDGPSFARYRYIIPASGPTNRPKVAPPEKALIGEAVSTQLEHGVQGATAHSGSRNRYPKTNNKDVNKLLSEAQKRGFLITKGGKGHIIVTAPNGDRTTIAHTPSSYPYEDIRNLQALGLGGGKEEKENS